MSQAPVIVHVSSEVAPFSKSGGLADVVDALGRALVDEGHRVLTVSPRYRGVAPDAAATDLHVTATLGGHPHRAEIVQLNREGVEHFFVDSPLFDREGLYDDHQGPFGDNHLRFALLCQAALHVARRWTDGDCVLHVHDWQAALVPIYLKGLWQPLGLLTDATTVLSMHNPMHQGRFPAGLFADLELPPRWFSPGALEFHGDLCLLKGGVLQAQQISTVSPTFAREILTASGGFGLHDVLASRAVDLTGILNGLDTALWNPATDPHLPASFDSDDLSGKAICKAELQAELGLPVDPDAPLFGSIGRLDPQKGIELVIDSVPWLAEQGAQLVVLGSAAASHRHLEAQLGALEDRYPRHVRAWIGFSEPLAHRIQGAADFFLMPSLFEPCGLTQMSALRYGAPPVVRRTGGLADSVHPADASGQRGTGFVFGPATGSDLREAMWRALAVFGDPSALEGLRLRGMATDFGWRAVVPDYEALYDRAKALAGERAS
ncbi:MAG: glycogen synthase [Myxococcales bacterium]|nr:glycogen synthase [Myxococcales bacterium]